MTSSISLARSVGQSSHWEQATCLTPLFCLKCDAMGLRDHIFSSLLSLPRHTRTIVDWTMGLDYVGVKGTYMFDMPDVSAPYPESEEGNGGQDLENLQSSPSRFSIVNP